MSMWKYEGHDVKLEGKEDGGVVVEAYGEVIFDGSLAQLAFRLVHPEPDEGEKGCDKPEQEGDTDDSPVHYLSIHTSETLRSVRVETEPGDGGLGDIHWIKTHDGVEPVTTARDGEDLGKIKVDAGAQRMIDEMAGYSLKIGGRIISFENDKEDVVLKFPGYMRWTGTVAQLQEVIGAYYSPSPVINVTVTNPTAATSEEAVSEGLKKVMGGGVLTAHGISNLKIVTDPIELLERELELIRDKHRPRTFSHSHGDPGRKHEHYGCDLCERSMKAKCPTFSAAEQAISHLRQARYEWGITRGALAEQMRETDRRGRTIRELREQVRQLRKYNDDDMADAFRRGHDAGQRVNIRDIREVFEQRGFRVTEHGFDAGYVACVLDRLVSEATDEVDRLARFIATLVPGEPSKSEGAVDTAIRIIRNMAVLLREAAQETTD